MADTSDDIQALTQQYLDLQVSLADLNSPDSVPLLIFAEEMVQAGEPGWETKSLAHLHVRRVPECFTTKHTPPRITNMAWHPNSKQIVCVSQDGKILIQDVFQGTTDWLHLTEAFLMTCSYSPSGKIMACGGLDNACTLYQPDPQADDYGGNAKAKCVLQHHDGYVSEIGWLSENDCLNASGDGTISLWDLNKQAAKSDFAGHSKDVLCLDTVKGDSNLFFTGSTDGTVRSWDVRQKRCTDTFFLNSGINCVKTLGAYTFGSGDDSGVGRIFDVRSKSQLLKCEDEVVSSLKKVEFSASGRYFFTGNQEGWVVGFDTLTGQPNDWVKSLELSESDVPLEISGLEVSPDGFALAVTARANIMHIFA